MRRGAQSDASAIALARVFFVRDDVVTGVDGVNGRGGWQAAEATAVLSDDGTFSLTLPNGPGDDGVLHRRRFRCLTDGAYEPGEEWLELWSDADPVNPLFVGTPTDYTKSTSTVTLTGKDLMEVLNGVLASDVDAWDAHAPADVIAHYARLPMMLFGADTGLPAMVGPAGQWSPDVTSAFTGAPTDCWTCEVDLRWTSPAAAAAGAAQLRLVAAGLTLAVDLFDGAVTLTGAPERAVVAKRVGLVVPGPVALRIVARYDRVFAFVAGELVAEFRRAGPFPALSSVACAAFGGTAAFDRIHVESLAAFATRGASAVIDRALPGIPPAIGLRGQYFNAAAIYAQSATRDGRLARLWPLLGEADAAVDRVDPTVNFPAGTAQFPPGLPGAYAIRWSGAIYLDLAANDRQVRVSGLAGNARLYIGRTLRGVDEAASSWAGPAGVTITTAALRASLGSVAGWFPIVVEVAHADTTAGAVLEDSIAGGAWAVVPQSRLSPIGVYADLVRLESHRSVIADVATSFGYQWRIEPRSVESGEFPGQLTARALLGRQTEIVIDDQDVGTDAEVQGACGDVIDGLLVDGSGIADPAGGAQLTVQTVDYTRAGAHLALRQAYESLSEISEQPMLAARADSLLALRSSPNEQVGVRPGGQRELVDTFPLTGQLARMDWRPGDGVRLALDTLDVIDTATRQLTSVAWSPKPDGLGAPTVSYRQRPRNARSAMRRLTRAIFGPRRNYQGTVAVLNGSLGATATTIAPDGYARAPLPTQLDDVCRVVVVVQALTGTGWRLEVAGDDLGPTDGAVAAAGRYDVTRQAKAGAVGAPQISARLIGGTGSYTVSLEIWVRI